MTPEITQIISALDKNNIKAIFAKTKSEVVPIISTMLKDNDTVSVGGSMSLFESGVIDHLRSGRYNFLDRYNDNFSPEELRRIYLSAMDADAYFCSCNAVTKSGELYNVDGNANRISAIAYGPKSVIMVVGINKIVDDLAQAVLRVKTITAPTICKQRGRKTYCASTGQCMSFQNSSERNMTAGCNSPERTCCSFLVSGPQRIKDRIKVILVNESLGY